VNNITFTYDEQNQLKTISYNEGKSSFTYLPSNEVKEEVSGLGRETYYYIYDNKGNLLSEERELNKNSHSSFDYKRLYKYDKAGRLIEKKYDTSYLKKQIPPLQSRITQG
jgi:putative YD repeat protein